MLICEECLICEQCTRKIFGVFDNSTSLKCKIALQVARNAVEMHKPKQVKIQPRVGFYNRALNNWPQLYTIL